MHVLFHRGPKAFQRHFAVCIFNMKQNCFVTQLILCLYLCRILAVCESDLKNFSVSQNSFICYTGLYFALHAKSLLSIKSRNFCLLVFVFHLGLVFIENLNL